MTVYFIGAGPGDPELITVKGQRLLSAAQTVLYAGSLIPEALLQFATSAHACINTAELDLEEILTHMFHAHEQGHNIARLQCGDPSFYSAVAEQIRRLRMAEIPYEIIPGVSSASAAAAYLGCELTLPGISQSIVYTRFPGKTPFHQGTHWAAQAGPGVCLAIFLSIVRIHRVCEELIPVYGEDCPVAVLHRVSWPDQLCITGTLADIVAKVRRHKINRTAIILVGEVLQSGEFLESYLYDRDKAHIYRPKYKTKKKSLS